MFSRISVRYHIKYSYIMYEEFRNFLSKDFTSNQSQDGSFVLKSDVVI